MLTNRRAFVRMAGGAALAAIATRSAVSAPPIVQAEITPLQFGATGGDPVADTLGWNEAVRQAAATGRPVVASGTYVLRVPSASRWNWGARSESSTHAAVQLLSGTHILGNDAQILVGRPERPPSGKYERHFLFGTDRNTKAGALRDIVLDGITFDFRDEFGPVHGFTYAVAVIGVDDFVRRNLTVRSSGKRAGRGLLAENIRRRSDENLKHLNILQGTYTRYEYGVSMRHIAFDGFTEAMDFDGPCWDVTLDDLSFRNGYGEAQCIDTGGGARWLITNVTAENVASIIYIYFKPTSRATYNEWLEGGKEGTAHYIPPENFTVRGVRAINSAQRKLGRHPNALLIGNFRSQHLAKYGGRSSPGPKDITIEDWSQKGGGQIMVNDCENLTMRRITMSDISTPDDPESGAALVLRESDPAFGGHVTGTVSDMSVRNSQGMGVSVVAGPGLLLSNISVDGFNLAQSGTTGAAIRMRPRKGSSGLSKLDTFHVTGKPTAGRDVDR